MPRRGAVASLSVEDRAALGAVLVPYPNEEYLVVADVVPGIAAGEILTKRQGLYAREAYEAHVRGEQPREIGRIAYPAARPGKYGQYTEAAARYLALLQTKERNPPRTTGQVKRRKDFKFLYAALRKAIRRRNAAKPGAELLRRCNELRYAYEDLGYTNEQIYEKVGNCT